VTDRRSEGKDAQELLVEEALLRIEMECGNACRTYAQSRAGASAVTQIRPLMVT
jgi:hypothetical protein